MASRLQFLAAAALLSFQTCVAQQWSIGYWGPFDNLPVTSLQWRGLTHIVQHAALVNADGTLDLKTEAFSTNAQNLVLTAHSNGAKALMCVVQQYWAGKTTNLQQAATYHLPTLVNSIMNAVATYGFDGVDIDWEPFVPGTNGTAMKNLAAALRQQLGSKLLTVAVGVADYSYWGSAHGPFDRVNVMSYDLAGTWNPYSWHNSAIADPDGRVWSYNLVATRFTKYGVPQAKLGLGIPFYGWRFQGGKQSSDPTQGITAPREYWVSTAKPTGSQINYGSILSLITSSNYHWDSAAQAPYLSFNGSTNTSDGYLTYDNPQSVTAKVNYITSKKLGGWIIWSLGTDAKPSLPLLNAVRTASAVAISTASALPAATLGVSYTKALTATGAAPITWRIATGSLPSGLTLSSSGVVSGVPKAKGAFSFLIEGRNFAGPASRQFTLSVQ